MVYRVYVEKKEGLANEAAALLQNLREFLGMKNLKGLRLFNRYDVEGIDEALFARAVRTVFSEPQTDTAKDTLPEGSDALFAVEALPGQFDQRADSAAQCIQILSCAERPTVKNAKVYLLYGSLTEEDVAAIKRYVINPVECREAETALPDTLQTVYPTPSAVETLHGFRDMEEDDFAPFVEKYGLAMDVDDLRFCREYFRAEKRDPTITELRLIDTYWSDHCRHTTFLTTVDHIRFETPALQKAYERYLSVREELGRTKPINLMDMGTIAAKYLKKKGLLRNLDESEEINACTVKITVTVDGKDEDWLLLFKNETHNHPTEIEPFGGAATCIGGAIRDPLSGRAYVYAAMRLTGAADPLRPLSETLRGKLPQRKIVTTAAAGYSSYGNQIGLATGQVDELYHDGYAAKRMEIGAVIGAVPRANVRRECPAPGDKVILLGGRTGRDGCGGATGSSKSHTAKSLESCGAEVQKGNAPEERKLQRLFRNPRASAMIKRCNDFGAGGVSVAIGELADGLRIDLDVVPKKYDGLDGTELAISESQERMAVVVAPEDVEAFKALAQAENLEATVTATVTAEPRMTMVWKGNTIVDLSREFLNSNGAEKHITVETPAEKGYPASSPAYAGDRASGEPGSFAEAYKRLAGDLNVCSKRGLSERFDSTIGAGTILMPFGGVHQLTPSQAMAHKISVEKGHTDCCSLMAWGYNPYIAEASPYHGAYLAVVESLSKLIAAGGSFQDVYLTFQEYMEKPGKDPKRWGKPAAALLGALMAQLDLGVAAIGGKDSMSGSFESLDVPPTLVSFAVTTDRLSDIRSPEFKGAGHKVVWLRPALTEDNLPEEGSLKDIFERVTGLLRSGTALTAYTPTYGGAAEAVLKMSMGNGIGFRFEKFAPETVFGYAYGSFLLEIADGASESDCAVGENGRTDLLGVTTEEQTISMGDEKIPLSALLPIYEGKLEEVFSCNISQSENLTPPTVTYTAKKHPSPAVKTAKPKVLIPVFPGTNCEYDSAKAFADAGAEPEILVLRNLTAAAITESVSAFTEKLKNAQIVFLPGGFSGGDEPDGSGKFITAFFRNPYVTEGVRELLGRRDGLMAGICNGFQALVKLGLVPYGDIIEADESCPTLTFNTIGRHQSRIVRTRIASNLSPWLMETMPGEIYTVPISHGEGRFLCSEKLLASLAEKGQIATQYVDEQGKPTYDIRCNPNNSAWAVEGVTSPDGRVFGKMGHSERTGEGLYKNVPGNYDIGMFRSAVKYFS